MPDRDDLLRVDSTGAVHPLGRAASQQLRAKVGEWRIIASPKELLVARSMTWGDAVLKLAGEIRTPGALSDIVSLAAQSGWRGELIVLEEAGQRSLYFDNGAVIAATTTVLEERLGETLYRFGVITREQLETIVRVTVETGKRLGEVAVESGVVSSEKLYAMMAQQVEEVFFSAIHVSDGAFYFFDRFDEKLLSHRHSLNAGGLLMEAARRMDEMRFFRERVPSDQYIPVPLPSVPPVHRKRPPEDLLGLLEHCDGTRSIADIGRATGRLEFDVTRAVFQLVSSGCVTVVAPRPRGPVAIVDMFNPALLAVHERCDAVGRGSELRDGLSRFATGGGVYDPLFMGAGPLPDGSLKSDRMKRNTAALAGDDPDAWLVGLMSDYVGFALFQAEAILSRDAHASLLAEITERLKPLRALMDGGTQARGDV